MPRHRSRWSSILIVVCVLASLVGLRGAARSQSQPIHYRAPEGFVVERVAGPGLLSYPMFATLGGPGKLFVFESTQANTMTTEDMLSEPSYHVRLLEDVDGDGVYDRSGMFADKLPFPMGGVMHGGSLYVSASPDLLKLTDRDGDGVADAREVVVTGWTLNVNGAALSGPFLGPDGWLYLSDARRGFSIRRKEGDTLSGKSARIWRVRPDGSGLESLAGGGFDNAVEIAFMPAGETIGTMTYFLDPRDGFRDALMHWVEGGVYPRPHPVIAEDGFVLTGELLPPMTRLARVAPSGLMRYRGTAWGESYADNLFSAQFNTGRVMRHVVTTDGGTFRSEDVVFLSSDTADVHPTDVLQDADGSLLVVETGGWFIKGCPLSRVAKPEIGGGIYRVRKADASPVSDAWGQAVGFASLSAERLVTLLADARPMVVDQAVEQLVSLGQDAVTSIVAALRQPLPRDAALAAVFALHRIDTPEARTRVRDALADAPPEVRTAAARAVGLARDVDAMPALEHAVVHDASDQVRRQAATALAQLASAPRGASPVAALLQAAARPADRFVEHAIVHALIAWNEPRPLLTTLAEPASTSSARAAALTALDQLPRSPLERKHLTPLLTSADERERRAALWVLGHRPAWGDLVADHLRASMRDDTTLDARDRELVVTFCGHREVQALVATRVTAPALTMAARTELLEVMGQCRVEPWPAVWSGAVRRLLQHDAPEVVEPVVRLVEARGLADARPEIVALADDAKQPAGVRLSAIGALGRLEGSLDDARVDALTTYLAPSVDAPVRHRAARILGQLRLNDAQLTRLASRHVAAADDTLLPRLLDPFVGGSDRAAGMALASALLGSIERLGNLSGEDLARLFSTYPDDVKRAARAVFSALEARHATRLAELNAVQASLVRGSIDEGRQVFFGKATCSTCHAVGGQGATFGPDLTSIGDIRSRHDILEAILFPSASLAREYETYQVTASTGTYTGVLKEQSADALVIETGPGVPVRLPRSAVRRIEPLQVSTMPPGLHYLLSIEELSHLVTYLESLPDPIERPGSRR